MVIVRSHRARRLALASVVVVAAVVAAGTAAAQPGPGPVPTTQPPLPPEPAPLREPLEPMIDPADPRAPAVPPSSGRPLPEPKPGSVMRMPEQLGHKPSGFWTSNRPAEGGAYRWRIMAMGGAVLAIVLFFLVRMLRRISRARLVP